MEEINNLQDVSEEYLERFLEYLPTLVSALLFLIFGWWAIKVILGSMKRLFAKRHYDLALQNFLLTILNWGLKILLFITVIGQLGIATASFLTMIGAAGLAIGLALQGSLSNFAGGVLIIILKPFKLGDWIEVNGISGSVKEISLFYTKLDTFGNQVATIPNGELSNDNIVNYSGNPTRRDAITIGVSYNSDIKKAKQVLLNLLHEQENILKDPAPAVVVTELADSAVNFSVRFWAANEVFWDCHWYTIEESKTRLEAVGISIPFPQRDVHFFDHSKNEPVEVVEK